MNALKHFSWLLLLLVLTASCTSKAEIKGTVKDYFGQPVENANVSIAGSAFKTVTDKNGHYQLEYVPGSFTVVFSKDGYSTYEMPLNLTEKTKFPAEEVTLIRLPDKPGVYLYRKEGLIALPPSTYDGRHFPISGKVKIAIKNLNRLLLESREPLFFTYGDQYSPKRMKIHSLKFSEEIIDPDTIRNRGGWIKSKSVKNFNMWTADKEMKFKATLVDADQAAAFIKPSFELGISRYAIHFGNLSAERASDLRKEDKRAFCFQYLNPEAFSNTVKTSLYLAESWTTPYLTNSLREMVFKLLEKRAVDEAIQTAEVISDRYDRFKTLSQVASKLRKENDLKTARVLLEKMHLVLDEIDRQEDQAEALAELAWHYRKLKEFEEASKLLQEALNKTSAIGYDSGVIRNLQRVYSQIVNEEALRPSELASRVLQETSNIRDKEKRTQFISDFISNLIQAQVDADRVVELISIAQLPKKKYLLRSIEWVVSQPDHKQYLVQLTQAFEKLGNYSFAVFLLRKIAKHNPEEAAEYLDRAIQNTEKIGSNKTKAKYYLRIASVMIDTTKDSETAEKLLRKALQLAEAQYASKVQNRLYYLAASVLAKLGKTAEALQLCRKIRAGDYKDWAKINIAVHLAKAKDIDKALRVASSIRKNRLENIAFKRIALTLIQSGEIDKAYQIAEQIRDSRIRTGALTELSEETVRNNNCQEALQAINKLKNQDNRNTAISIISIELAKLGKVDDGLHFAEKISSPKVKLKTFKIMANELLDRNETSKALQVVNKLEYPYPAPAVFSKLVFQLVELGKLDEAISFAKRIDSDSYQYRSYEEIVLKCLELGTNLKKVTRLAATSILMNRDKGGQLLRKVLQERLKSESLDEVLRFAEEFGWEVPVAITLEVIAMKEADKNLDKALALINKIKPRAYRIIALAKIAAKKAEADLFLDAIQLTKTLSKDEKSETRYAILEQLIEVHNNHPKEREREVATALMNKLGYDLNDIKQRVSL